jgi:hypothetical protein
MNGVGKHRWTVPEDTLSLIRELARLMPDQQIARLLMFITVPTPQFRLIPKWESGRVSTSKFAVTLWPVSSHRHRRSARLRRCQAQRTSLPRLKEPTGAERRLADLAAAGRSRLWQDPQRCGVYSRPGHPSLPPARKVVRVRLLVMLADRLASIRRAVPLHLLDRRCRSPR